MISVYVLEGKVSEKRDVGITNDLPWRLREHRGNESKAGQILDQFQLIHSEEIPDYPTARAREKFLKSSKAGNGSTCRTLGHEPASGGQGRARA